MSKDPGWLTEAEEMLRHALMIEPGLTWALGYLTVVLDTARGDPGALEEAMQLIMQLCEQARTAAASDDVGTSALM
jgi:hypothetical protein